MKRRNFLKTTALAGGGLLFGVVSCESEPMPAFQANRFLIFQPDGFVRLFSGRTEMGQGTNWSIKLMAAEELCMSPNKILLEVKSPEEGFWVGTGGSWGIAGYFRQVRPIFAAARQVFIHAAAKKWEIAPTSCTTKNGMVIHANGRKRIAYSTLLNIATTLETPAAAEPLPFSDYQYLGKSLPLELLNDQVTGKIQYGIDQYVEGMLHASIERCPVVGGRLKSLADSEALAFAGVEKVLPYEGTAWEAYDYYPAGVAVLAKNSWAAQEGRKRLKIEWVAEGNQKINNAFVQQIFDKKLKQEGIVFKETGNYKKAIREADEVMEAIYNTPFWSHSPMEPMNTIAHYQSDKCEIWSPCHAQTRLLEAIKKITGFSDQQIIIHTPYLGGSFGRRLLVDYAIEAVLLSQKTNAPVQVLYSREDETKFGHFMSAGKYHFKAAIKNNQPTAFGVKMVHLSTWSQREPNLLENGIDYSIVDGLLRTPYEIPNQKQEQQFANEVQIPVSWWRGTYVNTIGFAVESWIDEIAIKTKANPLDFRLSLLKNDQKPHTIRKDEKMDKHLFKRVLEVAAEKANWRSDRKANEGKGISACFTFFESYAAMVAEVRFDENRQLKIKKMTCAVDCGTVLHPNMVKAQIEGGIVFALSAMLGGSINFENGRVVENNFTDYAILRYEQCPEIAVHILESDRPVCGVGELANIPTFAAVSNAIYDAIGVRVRSLPLKNSEEL